MRMEVTMAEVLVEYDTVIAAEDGSRWVAHACGQPGRGSIWEGWIEFVPLDPERDPERGPRETTQPNHDNLIYWATGLTPAYLKGALTRALEPPVRLPALRRATPLFDGPASTAVQAMPPRPGLGAILDPFHVYAQGEEILIRQLDALDTPRLRGIASAYAIRSELDSALATREELVTAIIEAARNRHSPAARR
jgi:hypothetical protein